MSDVVMTSYTDRRAAAQRWPATVAVILVVIILRPASATVDACCSLLLTLAQVLRTMGS